VPDQLALTEPVEHLTAIDQLNRSGADDPHVPHRFLRLTKNDLARSEVLDLHRRRDAFELRFVDAPKRGMSTQKLGYWLHTRRRGVWPGRGQVWLAGIGPVPPNDYEFLASSA
jgi:hypothetical protein